LNYDCLTFTVAVTGPQSTHDKIAKYFPPVDDGSPAQMFITLTLLQEDELWLRIDAFEALPVEDQRWGDPSLKYNVRTDGRSETYVPMTEAPHLLQVEGDRDALSISISAADSESLGRTCVRMMRQLMLRRAEFIGGRDARGAAVTLNGCGLVLAGLPGAGKSTVALTLAQNNSAKLVASDHLVFVPLPIGDWIVAGTPVPWSLADGTIRGVSKLDEAFAAGLDLHRGNHLVDSRHELITEELSAILGVDSVFETAVDAVIVLSQSDETAVREIHGVGKLPLLAQTLFNPDDRLFVTDWLGKHTLVQDSELAFRGHDIARTVRVFEATWRNYADIKTVASMIAAIFGDGSAPQAQIWEVYPQMLGINEPAET